MRGNPFFMEDTTQICGIKNIKMGPRTEPWGSPKSVGDQAEILDPKLTTCERAERKELIYPSESPKIPKEVSRRIDWPRIPKAALTAKKQEVSHGSGQSLKHISINSLKSSFNQFVKSAEVRHIYKVVTSECVHRTAWTRQKSDLTVCEAVNCVALSDLVSFYSTVRFDILMIHPNSFK